MFFQKLALFQLSAAGPPWVFFSQTPGGPACRRLIRLLTCAEAAFVVFVYVLHETPASPPHPLAHPFSSLAVSPPFYVFGNFFFVPFYSIIIFLFSFYPFSFSLLLSFVCFLFLSFFLVPPLLSLYFLKSILSELCIYVCVRVCVLAVVQIRCDSCRVTSGLCPLSCSPVLLPPPPPWRHLAFSVFKNRK